MKRLYIYAGLLLAFGAGLTGCYKDTILPDAVSDSDGPPQAVSYSADLAPLFNKSCALSGCHVEGSQKPYMKTDISYLQIVNGGFVNTLIPKQSILYLMINDKMQEFIPAAADRKKVYDWIRNGALNN
jgi:hypothetical protein